MGRPVKRHGSFVSLLQSQQARFAKVAGDMDAAVRELAVAGREDLFENTAGRLGQKDLDRMGNPYGRGRSAKSNYVKTGDLSRRGASGRGKARLRAPLLPINRQSGQLRRSVRFVRRGAGVYDVGIGSTVSYARYVLHPAGTVLMVGRGLLGWRKVRSSYPMGLLERRFRTRQRALADALREAGRS